MQGLTADLKQKGAEFVVWSETSATFPTREDVGMKQGFFANKFAASLGVPAIWGAVLYRPDSEHPENEKWFNTALSTNAKIVVPSDAQLVNIIGDMAGIVPLGQSSPTAKLQKHTPESDRRVVAQPRSNGGGQ